MARLNWLMYFGSFISKPLKLVNQFELFYSSLIRWNHNRPNQTTSFKAENPRSEEEVEVEEKSDLLDGGEVVRDEGVLVGLGLGLGSSGSSRRAMRSSIFLLLRWHGPGCCRITSRHFCPPLFYHRARVDPIESETAIDSANASGISATPAKSKKITHFISSPDGDGGWEKIEIQVKIRRKKIEKGKELE